MATVISSDVSPQPIAIPSTPQKGQQKVQPDTPSTCPGTPAAICAALAMRVDALKAFVETAPRPNLSNIFPAGSPPALKDGEIDAQVWEDILVKFGAGGVPAARDAQHFEEVIKAGMDANAVFFPKMELRQGSSKVFILPLIPAPAPYQDAVPFPFLLPLAEQGDQSDADKAAVKSLLVGRAKGPDDLRAAMYIEKPLDLEVVPWPRLEDGVVAADACTDAQSAVWEARAKKPLSLQSIEKRRAVLAKKFSKDGNECELNPRVFEEVRPELEREAAILEFQAARAREKAEEARMYDELAEQGAAYTTWPVPNELRWPDLPSSWKQHAKWFMMWRSRPLEPSSFAFQPIKRSDSMSSLNSWAAVSDVSWVQLESRVSECGWEQVLDEELPALDSFDPTKNIKKGDITEIKAMSKPPVQVVLTMEVICVLMEVKPEKLKNGGVDYWSSAKTLLGDANFLNRVLELRDYVPVGTLHAVAPYMTLDEFKPENIGKGSKACQSLCQWAREIYRYHTLSSASAEADRKRIAAKTPSELLADMQAGLDSLSKPCIQELKALAKPPARVADICNCFVHLFAGISPGVELTRKGYAKKADWRSFQKLASNPSAFFDDLKQFTDAIDSGKVPRRNIERVRRIQINMGSAFNPDAVKTASVTAACLCAWIRSIIAYYDVAAPLEPAVKVCEEGVARTTKDNLIHKGDIVELKSLAHPPQIVKEVVSAAVLLLGYTQEPEWDLCKKAFGDPCFLQKMLDFNAEQVSSTALAKAKAIAEQPDFCHGKVKRQSAAAASLAVWVLRAVGLEQKSSAGA